MPVSSPAAPGLTSPRALRSRVLQALSTSEDVAECFLNHPMVHQVLPVVFQVLPSLHRGYEVLKPRIFFYMVRDELALHME